MEQNNQIKTSDNTIITYSKIGNGPSIVFVHGGLELSNSHIELATILSQKFTVYIYDRRDRGESIASPSTKHCMKEEVKDLTAIISHTQAQYIFAVSVGALITLEFLRTNTSIKKAILYEPPALMKDAFSFKWATRLNREIQNNKTLDALITGMRGMKMTPPLMKIIPRFILKKGMMSMNKQTNQDFESLRKLVPTLYNDIQLVIHADDPFLAYAKVQTQILLIGGQRSPKYLKIALANLQKILPNASTIILKKCDHLGSSNKQVGGHPDLVANEIVAFIESK